MSAIADRHLKKNTSSQCQFHPAQSPRYYCSDSKCRTLLCLLCMKTHPKEHLPTVTTFEEVKSQTLEILKKETLKHVSKTLDDILASRQANDLFKEALGTLMRQNTTVGLDEEDMADIIADSLQRKYFEKGVVVTKNRVQEIQSVRLLREDLIAFDYEFDEDVSDSSIKKRDHEKNARKFCGWRSDYYCRQKLGSFYAKSKEEIIFWNTDDHTLLCKDTNNFKAKKYQVPSPFRFMAVLESEKLLFVTASNDKLIVYLIDEEEEKQSSASKVQEKNHSKENNGSSPSEIEEEHDSDDMDSSDEKDSYNSDYEEEILTNHPHLKIGREFSIDEEISFLESDHQNHLFVVTQRERKLTANIYALNDLELIKILSFELSDPPKKVKFDRENHLFFILSNNCLQIYKHNMPLTTLKLISRMQTEDFSWHQQTKRLLLADPRKLFQFDKGKFRLIRTLDSAINPFQLTNKGVLSKVARGFYFLELSNPTERKRLVLPSFEHAMERLLKESKKVFEEEYKKTLNKDSIGKLETYQALEVIAEIPEKIFVFAYVRHYQEAQYKDYYEWSPAGGKIETQNLIVYNLNKKLYKIL